MRPDHKTIGRQYLLLGAGMAVVGGLLAYLVRWQLAWPGTPVPGFRWVPEPTLYEGIVPEPAYNAFVTMHGTIMMFFVAMPILVGGFGNFLVPLMIGAREMAFPRLGRLSVGTFAVAALLLLASFVVENGAASAGWTAYAPLSADATYTAGVARGLDLWIVALTLELVAFVLGSINLVTTVLNARAPGMTWWRLPLFVWMQLAAAVLFLASVGPLVAAALMLLADRTLGSGFFLPERGGEPLLWQHLFWFFGHPEVYVIMLPGFGIVMEILPVFARKPFFGYRAVVWATIAAGALSLVVWAHHMFVSGIDPRLAGPFSVTTILVSVPFAIMVGCMLLTLLGGTIELATPMLFALGTLATFLVGGVTGVYLGAAALDIYLHDTYFVVAHFHFTLFPAVVLGGLAGLYYWFPKMFGRMLDERLGKIHFWLTFLSFNAVFLPLFLIGLGGHMRRIYDASQYTLLAPFVDATAVVSHGFVTRAAILLLAAQTILVVNVLWTLVARARAADNPWRANTLEWTTTSPPPRGNFLTMPTVYRDPYEYSPPDAATDWLPQSLPDPRGTV